MKHIGKITKIWSKRTFTRANKKINQLKDEITKLQNQEFSEQQQERIKDLKVEISQLWKKEEKYWGQRARLKWLKFGDKNTSFFHATTIQRRDLNKIERLKDAEENWITGSKDIMKLVERHFTDLFATTTKSRVEECTQIIPKKVTVEMNRELLKEVLDKEIRDAAFSIGSLKAPSPDGLSSVFFQKHWDIISREVCDVIKDIFASRRMPEDMGETTVVLIPKVKQPEYLS
ncbi:uncharacterized protein [Arachis hypogaea]|uniref:uncharacterized protein n=1 Tax=Arachis hypogaea TaxID=3818 RepID=UPI003B213A5F